MSLVRAFVAVLPPDAALDELQGCLKRLKPLARLRWVTRAQLHLTLRFLGERTPELLEKVKTELQTVRMEPFTVTFGSAGAFPNLAQPRVLWLGVDQGSEALTGLAGRVESAVERAGVEREPRPFRSHLTLARVDEKGRKLPPSLVSALQALSPTLAWRCEGFSLMKSELTPRGAVHTPLATVRWNA